MLLDRRRIRKWAKWVALGLAIIFAAGFLVGGIGYGTGGFSLLDSLDGGCTPTTEPVTAQGDLDKYLVALALNAGDTTAMQGAATEYLRLYQAGEGQDTQYLQGAIDMLERALEADPSLNEVYTRLADIYISAGMNQAAVATLNKAILVDPNNPDIFLKLGTAQKSLGNIGAAALAWQKYLQLDPNGEYAKIIQQQLDALTGSNTTSTTGAATTTTLPAATTSTTAVTTSTTG